MIEGVRKRARVFVGDSIVRKTDRVLNKGEDVVVCLPGAKIEAITERVENIVGLGKGGSVLVHVGTLPVIGRRGHRYQNCRGMAINTLVEKGEGKRKWVLWICGEVLLEGLICT